MTDQSHDITTSESVEPVSEQTMASSTKASKDSSTKQKSKYDDGPGWEMRLFIRALLAKNVKDLLKRTGHTQSELQFYTGLSKQTVSKACNVKSDLSDMDESSFNNNTFVLTICWYIDHFIATLNIEHMECEDIVRELVEHGSDKFVALSDFLKSKGLTPEQITEYANQLYSPKPFDLIGNHCRPFIELWTESFKDFEAEVVRELKGQRFKDAVLDTCGADSFDFTKAHNVYFDLVFLQQAELGSDIFMRPLLNCLTQNKVRCLLDKEQLYQLRPLMMKARWKHAIFSLTSCKNGLSDPNIDSATIDKNVSCANQQLQFILLLSKLMRNLAILCKLELVPYRDKEKYRPIDLLLGQKFAAADYSDQAVQLIEGMLSGLNSFSKRRKIDLDSAYSFLDSLNRTKGNPYYIFTASSGYCWPFNQIRMTYIIALRNCNACELFCKPKKNGIELHKDLHVLHYCSPSFPRPVDFSSDRSQYQISSLELLEPMDQSKPCKMSNIRARDGLMPLNMFEGKLDTYYQLTADGFEVDKSRGGAKLFAKLHLDATLQSVLDQLPDAYYGMILSDSNKPQDMAAALDKVLERGGFEG